MHLSINISRKRKIKTHCITIIERNVTHTASRWCPDSLRRRKIIDHGIQDIDRSSSSTRKGFTYPRYLNVVKWRKLHLCIHVSLNVSSAMVTIPCWRCVTNTWPRACSSQIKGTIWEWSRGPLTRNALNKNDKMPVIDLELIPVFWCLAQKCFVSIK